MLKATNSQKKIARIANNMKNDGNVPMPITLLLITLAVAVLYILTKFNLAPPLIIP